MKILVLNGGSSSFKCWFHDVNQPLPVTAPDPLWQKQIEWHGERPLLEALSPALNELRSRQPIEAVGHRIVHGGKAHRDTTRLTAEVRAAIAQEAELAPSHNRFELEAIEAVDRLLGIEVPQIAVFDTAFHASLEPAAYVYPGPYGWLSDGLRRFGFHGISYQYAARRAAQMLDGAPASRLILCHLGSGCSLAAVRDGKCVDTTMGFTPLEGLMMGTRCGSIDPGIIIYLLRHCGYTADQLDGILNRESGLKGVSGVSGDMREVMAAAKNGNDRARLAFDIYVHRCVEETGSMLAVLGGADAIVFTGGVGENCAPLRERVCRQFGFLGLRLDPLRNQHAEKDADIAAPESAVRVLVIHAEEDWEIARECYRCQAASG
ncbi:MAG: acetate kinase [Terriglobia bacterium]|nr:MAG: acetate kinase [Terriglobia bacterium]